MCAAHRGQALSGGRKASRASFAQEARLAQTSLRADHKSADCGRCNQPREGEAPADAAWRGEHCASAARRREQRAHRGIQRTEAASHSRRASPRTVGCRLSQLLAVQECLMPSSTSPSGKGLSHTTEITRFSGVRCETGRVSSLAVSPTCHCHPRPCTDAAPPTAGEYDYPRLQVSSLIPSERVLCARRRRSWVLAGE